MAKQKYDIFISYRRKGGAQYARILQLMLSQRGYKVFLDYDELTDGVFGEHIKTAIKEAPVFMLILSERSLERCVHEEDWVRQEILLAVKEGKHFVPVNPDSTFDGVPDGVPDEIRTVASSHQHSEIGFGQTLGVTIDLMIQNRLEPTLGKRDVTKHVDTDFHTANETLEKRDAHNRLLKRLGTLGIVVLILLVIITCGVFLHQHSKNEHYKKVTAELQEKYKGFNLQLSPNLSLSQINTIDDILDKMVPVNDTLWMNQFEFSTGWWYGLLGAEYDELKKDYPITDVSYGYIYNKVLALGDMTGIYFDIPSVEEWEYAARGGENHETTIYAGSNDVDSVAWYKNNSGGQPHPSNGQTDKTCNSLDLFDMSGNVGEICKSPFNDKGLYTVCGGNYESPASEVTISSRVGIDTNDKAKTVGFRLIIRKQQ